ncbi:MAG: inverse autotransporter beta domain-containing protein, partial [Gammaproteobacteria bacterium]|nr:inverse autotransporter beta domain-containing protein [Gammaproteobacteria bacterium]
MVRKQVGILTGMVFAISPIYAAVNLTPSAYLPRETVNVQAGHGWQDSIDVLIPLFNDTQHLPFIDGSVVTADTSTGGEIGLGYRQLADDDRRIYSAYTFLGKYKTNDNSYFYQTNLGLEILSTEWDARLNAYLPIGNHQHLVVDSLSNLSFAGHKLIGNQTMINEIAESGANVEIGRLIPGFTRDDANLRAYFAYYHNGFNSQAKSTNGEQIRAEYRYNNYLTLTASEAYDNLQGNQIVLGIRLSNGGYVSSNQSTIEYRMMDYITRRQEVVTIHRSQTGPYTSPENFYFVDNSIFSGGNGTYERPYSNVQSAETAATNDGNPNTNYVYIYRGNGAAYNIGQLTIGRNQIFMGSGTDLIYHGIDVLAGSANPLLTGGLIVSSNNVLSGFNLDGTASGLTTGISGNGVANITIENVNISNYTGQNGTDGTNGQNGQPGNPGGPPNATDGTAGTSGQAGTSVFGIHLTNAN